MPEPVVMRRPSARRQGREIQVNLVDSAKSAGLRYVTDCGAGIRRMRVGKHFSYVGAEGLLVRDKPTLERIRALGIPPAWTDVWICPNPLGHLQVTGKDAKGRKQYRYHSAWRAVRDATKYDRMIAFGEALSTIRTRIAADLAQSGLPRSKILAAVVRLLDETSLRIGNQEYARENDSYGLTTLQSNHAEVTGTIVRLRFRGKNGKAHEVEVRDRRVARIVQHCQELPGYELFQYLDDDGELRAVDSSDVNEYLHQITGQPFTAKDFRTWTGTVETADTLRELGPAETETERKSHIVQAIKVAAERLGNTPAICRKSYVHPGVLQAYTHDMLPVVQQGAAIRSTADRSADLRPDEVYLLGLLHQIETEARAQTAAS